MGGQHARLPERSFSGALQHVHRSLSGASGSVLSVGPQPGSGCLPPAGHGCSRLASAVGGTTHWLCLCLGAPRAHAHGRAATRPRHCVAAWAWPLRPHCPRTLIPRFPQQPLSCPLCLWLSRPSIPRPHFAASTLFLEHPCGGWCSPSPKSLQPPHGHGQQDRGDSAGPVRPSSDEASLLIQSRPISNNFPSEQRGILVLSWDSSRCVRGSCAWFHTRLSPGVSDALVCLHTEGLVCVRSAVNVSA